ncbi:MAG: hypothetical protein O6705_04525, partial [Actinobacteria bacterium]|nr:hypothetical protein [Actinomycetota bacterium]
MDERIATRKATKEPVADPVLLAASEAPAIRTEALHFSTNGPEEFWDLTEFVRDVVDLSYVSHVHVTVYTPPTTKPIVINESETGFLND